MNTPITDAAKWINAYPEYHEGATRYVDSEFARRLETDRAALMEALSQMIGDLPQRRDWLNPVLEASAKHALSTARANFPQP